MVMRPRTPGRSIRQHRGGPAAARRRVSGAVAEMLPPSPAARDRAGTEALQKADDGRSSPYGLVQGCHEVVQVSRNETPQGSWRADLALGPADRIIVDGRSAAHAVQQLLAVLPAALTARPQHEKGHAMPTIKAFHPSGFEVLVQVPSLEEMEATIADLLRRGYRPAVPDDGRPCTPEAVPRCPTYRVPME